MTEALKAHPLADVLPLIGGKQFLELVQAVKANGLREPITTLDGMILDGRNRYRACLLANVEPRFVEFNGPDPVAFVVDVNVNRRHLSSGQRAMAIAQYCSIRIGRAKKDEGSKEPSLKAASKIMGVPYVTLKRAGLILRKGTTEEIGACKNGTSSVSAVAKSVGVRAAASRANGRSLNPPSKPRGLQGGIRLAVPEGTTLSDLCRRGLELEKAGLSSEEAAAEIKLARNSYKQIRLIVKLCDLEHLGRKDAATVSEAVKLLDETRQPGAPYAMIKAISQRVWGSHGNSRSKKTEKKLAESFQHAITMISVATERLAELTIPYLAPTDVEQTLKSLRDSERDLRAMRERIKETCQ